MQMILLPKYEQILSDTPCTILDYVCCIGRRLTLQLCTHFMYEELQNEQQNVIEFWGNYFCHENRKFAQDVICKILEISNSNRVSIIHSQNLYMLIEAALSAEVHEDILPIPSNAKLELLFFKALLAANNVILKKQSEGLNETENFFSSNPSINKIPILILTNQLVYGDYEFALNDEVVVTQLYKCVYFFNFVEQHYPKHLKHYLNEKGFKDWKEYIKVLCGLVFKAIKKKKGHTLINIQSENNDNVINCCLQLCSTKIYEYHKDLDFIELRNHPLFRWNENDFLILSNLFLSEKLYQSIYFDLKLINDKLLPPDRIDEFKAKLGLEFSERILLYEVLNRLFRDNIVKKTGVEIDNVVGDGGCDYYARSGNKVYIFECKDILMPKQVKTSYNASIISEFLYDRLVQSKAKRKAVMQLLQNIQFIRDNKIEPSRTDGAKMTIYPVIVTHHRVFDTPAINYLINYWFQQKLQDMDIVNKDRIKPIVIINVDTLIVMKDLCHQKSIALKVLMDKYISTVLRNDKLAMRNSYLSFADKMHNDIFSTHQFPKGADNFAKMLFEGS